MNGYMDRGKVTLQDLEIMRRKETYLQTKKLTVLEVEDNYLLSVIKAEHAKEGVTGCYLEVSREELVAFARGILGIDPPKEDQILEVLKEIKERLPEKPE